MAGYKNPPLHTRFKKGQSGNPQGRPKQATPTGIIDKVLMEKITATDRGRKVRFSRYEALIRMLNVMALQGNIPAAKLLLQYCSNPSREPEERINVVIQRFTDPNGNPLS